MIPDRSLRQARRRAGLTQRQLAVRTGVPQSTIGRIEAGSVDPRVSTLDRLLRACGDELDAVPRRGVGVDPTVVRSHLRDPPLERVRNAASAADAAQQLREAHRRSRSAP